jgi:tetratricopeptide (TPR) repeat protein
MALRRNPRSVRNLVIGAALGVAFVGLGVGVWFGLRPVDQPSAELPVVLASVDRYVADGYLAKATDELRAASRRARGVSGWLTVLKRGFAISRALGDFELLFQLSEEATAAVPRNHELRAVAGFAALRTDRLNAAAGFLDGLPPDRFASLLAEHALRDDDVAAPAGLPTNLRRIATLHRHSDPQDFLEAADSTGDHRFARAAALLFAGDGRLLRAHQLAENRLEADQARMLLLLLAYDAGSYEAAGRHAEEVLEERGDRADILLVYADTLRELGEPATAAEVWKRVVDAFPRYSWKPYACLAALEARAQRNRVALSWIDAARQRFPDVEALVVDQARLLYAEDRREEARALLEEHAGTHVDTELAQAALLELFPSHPTPERYRAALWQAFNRYPGNARIASALVWYLYGYSDVDGIRTVLRRHARNGARTGWLEFHRGAVAALSGELEEAQSRFQRTVEIRPGWDSRYNLAIVLMMRRRYREAMEHLREADSVLQARHATEVMQHRSAVRLQLARCLAALGNPEAGLRELRYALDLDPGNHEARLVAGDLRNSLEGGE